MIYIDTNVLVYAIENHPKYGASCKRILEAVMRQEIKACASILVLVEILNVLVRINKELKGSKKQTLDVLEMVNAVQAMPIRWFDINSFIIETAARYSYNMNGIDYIHAATMELNSVNEIISADKDFNKVNFVSRRDPIEYVELEL